MRAADKGRLDVVVLLLFHSADIKVQDKVHASYRGVHPLILLFSSSTMLYIGQEGKATKTSRRSFATGRASQP
jgi:hypothetical protein